jgi:UDP-glucose 4-epimerase
MSRVVLVTGGAGFIGSHLVERLCGAGEQVSVIDDLSRGRREWIHPAADLHEADIRDASAIGRVVSAVAPDVVFHLAALHFIPAVDDAPEIARDVNVNGTRTLLAALAEHVPQRVLFTSTAAVYPDRRGPIEETCPAAPLDVYGETKLAGERLVREFAAQVGTRCVIARLFNAIGPRETNPHVVPELVRQLRAGATSVRLGNLEPRRDYTDARDVAAALHALVDVPADTAEVFNVGSGRSFSVGELVAECEHVLGHPVAVETEEARLRTRDRAELVADPRRLQLVTGWTPVWLLRDTLAQLLGPTERTRAGAISPESST